jgi:hypothetical protein
MRGKDNTRGRKLSRCMCYCFGALGRTGSEGAPIGIRVLAYRP